MEGRIQLETQGYGINVVKNAVCSAPGVERLTYLPFWRDSFPANTISEAILSGTNACPCALVECPSLLLSLLLEKPVEIQHCCFQSCPGVVATLHPCSSSVHHLLRGAHCLR